MHCSTDNTKLSTDNCNGIQKCKFKKFFVSYRTNDQRLRKGSISNSIILKVNLFRLIMMWR